MPKTVCGVQVLTWSTHPGGGNGMMHFLDSQLFGGTTGHAALMLTFPANEEGHRLVEQYCKKHNLPFVRKKVEVASSVRDEKGNLKKGEKPAFSEDVYEVYWSWWPDPEAGQFGEAGKFELIKDPTFDTKSERRAVPFEWDPKWAQYVKPERRFHKGTLGGRPITYGPSEVLHLRDLQSFEVDHLDAISKVNDAIDKSDAIGLLERRLLTKKDQREADKSIVFSYKDFSKSEKLILERFFPDWVNSIKNQDFITEENFTQLDGQISKLSNYYDAIVKLAQREGIIKLKKILKDSAKPIQVHTIKSEYLDALSSGIFESWEAVIRRHKELPDDAAITVLDESDVEALIKVSNETMIRMKDNPRVFATIETQNLKIILEFIAGLKSKLEILEKSKLQDKTKFESNKKELMSHLLSRLKNVPINSLEEFLLPDNTWEKIKDEGLSMDDLMRLEKLAKAKYEELKDNQIVEFARDSLYKDIVKEKTAYTTSGTPPQGLVRLPIKPIGNSDVGIKSGLDVEKMLKQMVDLTDPTSEGFHLFKKNCSKTVVSILERGATKSYQKAYLRNEAFGYFGNPQEAYNNALNFRKVIERGKPNIIARLLAFNPIERTGGYLIGIFMDSNLKKDLAESDKWWKKAGVRGKWAGKMFLVGVGLLTTGSLALVFKPLNTVKGGAKFIKFAFSKKSIPLKMAAGLLVAPVVLVLSPLAGLNWIIKKGITDPISRMGTKKHKKLNPVKPKEILKQEVEEKSMNKQKLDEMNIKYSVLDLMVDVKGDSLDEVFKEFQKQLDRDPNVIPVLSKKTSKMILDKIAEQPEAKKTYHDLSKKAMERTLKAQARVIKQNQSVDLDLMRHETTPGFDNKKLKSKNIKGTFVQTVEEKLPTESFVKKSKNKPKPKPEFRSDK